MWWIIALGILVVLAGAPSDAAPRVRRDPTWFDHLAAMQATGRRARRSR